MGGVEPPFSTFWVSAWTQSRNSLRVCSQVRSGELGWLCPAVSLPDFIKERVALPPTCLKASTRVSLSPAAPHVARCLHPMPVAAAEQSSCLRGHPGVFSVLGGGTWHREGAPLSEAGVLRLPPSGPAGRPVSSIPTVASRSSRRSIAT